MGGVVRVLLALRESDVMSGRKRAMSTRERAFLRRRLINRAGGKCEVCGEPVNLIEDHPRSATIEHIVTVADGGADTLDNLKLACLRCNYDENEKHQRESTS